ncbi:MAG: hypothetical protein FD161_63 [Limisphaerales bacterium]|nr:MAG: hypothetical protein FD161_63 [Limisphaerales bacterium]KAG0510509.1 MAG: hypothetical protein E1N63_63 [Limisphaerales bacterium]TXT52782.1 MAG: hypothetical protein FD140_325 [Limisphaerales bacterium]
MSDRVQLSRAVNDQAELVADWAAFMASTGVPPGDTVIHELKVNRDLIERYVWVAGGKARSGAAHLLIAELQFIDDNQIVARIPFVDIFGLPAADLEKYGFAAGQTTTGVPCVRPYVKLNPMLGNNFSEIDQLGAATQQPSILLSTGDGDSTNTLIVTAFFLRVRCQMVRYFARTIVNPDLNRPLFTGMAVLSQYP